MRIRAGSQAKTGMAEEKETKGIDFRPGNLPVGNISK